MSVNSITATAGSRIHISLADLGFSSLRSYGGVGFMIDLPAAVVEISRTARSAISGLDSLDQPAQRELAMLVELLTEQAQVSAQVRLLGHAPQHVGLGSKTAIKLSIIAAFDRLFGIPRSREDQQRLSGRGSASGIGIHGFYEGGVIWDAGQLRDHVSELLPSSACQGPMALMMLRLSFPEEWHVGLALCPGSTLHGAEEVEFVRQRTPVAEIDALRTMAELYHGVLPAFKMADLESLRRALFNLAGHGFKQQEIARCGTTMTSMLGELQANGYACGVSSLGPLAYTISAKSDVAGSTEIRATCEKYDCQWLGFYGGLNRHADFVLECDK